MYQLFVEGHFDAAHRLRNYHGRCESLHGHRYKVVVRVEADEVDRSSGMVCDFGLLKKYLKDALSEFDHAYLNEVPPFDKTEPSSENLAAVIYGELEPRLARGQARLSCVEVWETPTTGAIYSRQA